MAPSPTQGTHRALVEALGEERSLAQLGSSEWLDSEAWSGAVDRVRRMEFAALSPSEGFRRVGWRIGERFFAGSIGRLVDTTLEILSSERTFASLVPALAPRMRAPFEYKWEPNATGGTLTVRGPIATAPEVTWGFFEVLARRLPGAPTVSLGRTDAQSLQLTVVDPHAEDSRSR
jgi:hypothetical protein